VEVASNKLLQICLKKSVRGLLNRACILFFNMKQKMSFLLFQNGILKLPVFKHGASVTKLFKDVINAAVL